MKKFNCINDNLSHKDIEGLVDLFRTSFGSHTISYAGGDSELHSGTTTTKIQI